MEGFCRHLAKRLNGPQGANPNQSGIPSVSFQYGEEFSSSPIWIQYTPFNRMSIRSKASEELRGPLPRPQRSLHLERS